MTYLPFYDIYAHIYIYTCTYTHTHTYTHRGEFVFSPKLGEIPLSGGKQHLTATFYPDDPSVWDQTEVSIPVGTYNNVCRMIMSVVKPYHTTYLSYTHVCRITMSCYV